VICATNLAVLLVLRTSLWSWRQIYLSVDSSQLLLHWLVNAQWHIKFSSTGKYSRRQQLHVQFAPAWRSCGHLQTRLRRSLRILGESLDVALSRAPAALLHCAVRTRHFGFRYTNRPLFQLDLNNKIMHHHAFISYFH
jgi:hypothetical protein